MQDLTALPVPLLAFLLLVELCIPLLGNLRSKYVSFLPAMRYYAGNWPISLILIKRSAYHKFTDNIVSAQGTFADQLWACYGEEGVRQSAEAKLLAWLSLHAHGRLLPKLIPKALPGGAGQFDEYQAFLGELLASTGLGYNFGDGHLHGSFVLNEFQERCAFAPGEMRQIWIDSCPMVGAGKYPWFIRDATDAFAPLEQGEGDLKELIETQPF